MRIYAIGIHHAFCCLDDHRDERRAARGNLPYENRVLHILFIILPGGLPLRP